MSTFTTNKNFEQPAHNSFIDTWDTPVNADWAAIDNAFGGVANINATGLSGNQVLTINQYQPLSIRISGSPGGNVTFVVPSGVGGQWVFYNNAPGTFQVGIASASGGSTIVIPSGANAIVTCDGSANGMFLAVNVPPSAGGANTQVQFNSGGLLAGSANMTFDGTTLSTVGLAATGNVAFGTIAGNTLTLNGSTLSIPNNLTIGTGNLLFLSNSSTQIAMGTNTPFTGALLTLAGTLKFTTGGITFADGTQLLSAASLAPAGVSGNIQFNNGAGGFAADATFTFNSGSKTINAQAGSFGTLQFTNLSAGTALTGMMFFFPGPIANVPSIALACFGQAISRVTFSALFAKIGTTWGIGDGSTTFNLPDFRGRVPAGLDNMGGTPANRLTSTTMSPDGNTVGATGGAQTESTTVPLSVAGNIVVGGTVSTAFGGSPVFANGGGGVATDFNHVHNGTFTGSNTLTGTGTTAAVTNVQPTALGNWVIFT